MYEPTQDEGRINYQVINDGEHLLLDQYDEDEELIGSIRMNREVALKLALAIEKDMYFRDVHVFTKEKPFQDQGLIYYKLGVLLFGVVHLLFILSIWGGYVHL